ncbi:amino acid transporter [Eremomyces bilateralis CBS 781.70]|uniref:Amino acid transporter n=1 Tax=Eremomyces bilateralis CBS 781.70 TaxID=1392243 RepID=A0A6G1GG91_9PEZI|nr:amino acid transporter [Eremomyces bilateralis CBS 781.70]KAF1817012.1 amino acid transporter [Eremomyces bilateralis CBS 781.70]
MTDFDTHDPVGRVGRVGSEHSSEDDPFGDLDLDAIITEAPEERFRLGVWSVMGLVFNRMIGTGIFQTPSRAMQGTGSTGATLMFWFAGIIYALCGVHVYIEYGLNVPRRAYEGVEQGVPRSGGDLNYLSYVFTKPAYRAKTVLLSATLFGVSFIIFGNMAGNAMSFAIRIMQAANVQDPSNGAVRGIAIAVSIFACFIHTFSRRGGIWLNNLLAVVKICMLLLIIIAAIIYGAGGFPETTGINRQDTVNLNLGASTSFKSSSSEASGYAQAFLSIIYAFNGFEQPNYVLGEIGRPHRKYPLGMITAVSLVCVLYFAVNICYMVVVPKELQVQGESVALTFFELTFGALTEDNTGGRVFNAFLAISSLGNIIVMTYTAARVKQEIAKEGIIPWAKFFASNSDLSLGRILRSAQRAPWAPKPFLRLLRSRWLRPEDHSEKTPFGALTLHLFTSFILIFATWGLTPENSYSLLTSLLAYLLNGIFGTMVGVGILILRFKKKEQWRKKASKINPFLSVLTAFIYTIGNLFPVIASWIKPSARFFGRAHLTLTWYLVPTISWACLGFGALWWFGFLGYAKHRERKSNTVFTVKRVPEFDRDPPSTGPPVQVHETVYLSWVGRETLEDAANVTGTDFDTVNVGGRKEAPTDFDDFTV